MKPIISILLLGLTTIALAADLPEPLQRDLDGDGKPDTISIRNTQQGNKSLRVHLSSTNQDISSSAVEWLHGDPIYFDDTRRGFEVNVSFMRGNHTYQFAYEAATKKIRLISVDTESLGNAIHDGAGVSRLNLLTGRFIGDWQHADSKNENLLSYPKMQERWSVKPIYLDDDNLDSALDALSSKIEDARVRQSKRKPIR